MKNLHFYSNGKLLISGEYLVLKGAKSLAIPVKFGQDMIVKETAEKNFMIHWKARVESVDWFDAVLDITSLEVIETNDIQKAQTLSRILAKANKLNPEVLKRAGGFTVKTNANFDVNWGLGSSSTLTVNVARWFHIDPFHLHFQTSKGSGYDIACAMHDRPIIYSLQNQLPSVQVVDFNPDFSDKLYFAYLGKKQRSEQSIRDLQHRLENRADEIERISEISLELISTHELEEFEFFIREHEEITSGILGIPTIRQTVFPDFPGTVKSLGAWGGDFVMLSWRDGLESLKKYLNSKHLNIVFNFDDLLLKSK